MESTFQNSDCCSISHNVRLDRTALKVKPFYVHEAHSVAVEKISPYARQGRSNPEPAKLTVFQRQWATFRQTRAQ
jgi:hypothetical protein|tara:strand:+ start:2146 stop:2370 length:225 start_codon:yes stop_codon:yes gene_type:complete